MKIYLDQPLEVKSVTVKDKKRLNRLKRKANLNEEAKSQHVDKNEPHTDPAS